MQLRYCGAYKVEISPSTENGVDSPLSCIRFPIRRKSNLFTLKVLSYFYSEAILHEFKNEFSLSATSVTQFDTILQHNHKQEQQQLKQCLVSLVFDRRPNKWPR